MKKAVIIIKTNGRYKGMTKDQLWQEIECKRKAKKLGYEVEPNNIFYDTSFSSNWAERIEIQLALAKCIIPENNIGALITVIKENISKNIAELSKTREILKLYGVSLITLE